MLDELQMQAQLEIRLAPWSIGVRQRASVCFPEIAEEDSVVQTLLTALGDRARSSSHRVTLAYISVHGKYPLPDAAKRVEAVLAVHGPARALMLLLEIEPSTTGRRRIAVRPKGVVIDVTRHVEEFLTRGIPRVVGNLLRSDAFRGADAIVWDDSAPSIVERSSSESNDGVLKFSKASWARPHRRPRMLSKFHSKLAQYRPILWMVSVGLYAFRSQILNATFVTRKPKLVVVLDQANLLIPEVPDTDVSKLTLNAIESFPGMRTSLILHDMLPLTKPEYFEGAAVHNHVHLTRLAAKCSVVIVATPIIGSELVAAAKMFDLNPPKIHEMLLPASRLRPSATKEIESKIPYFVFMGGFDPRKGLLQLFDHLSAYDHKQLNFQILVVGSPGPNLEQMNLSRKIQRSGSVFRVLNQLTDTALADLMLNSRGVLYPSFAEGYGLPILEAVLLGVPVLVRSTPTNLWLASQFPGIDTEYAETDAQLLAKLKSMVALKKRSNLVPPENIPTSTEVWSRTLSQLTVGYEPNEGKSLE